MKNDGFLLHSTFSDGVCACATRSDPRNPINRTNFPFTRIGFDVSTKFRLPFYGSSAHEHWIHTFIMAYSWTLSRLHEFDCLSYTLYRALYLFRPLYHHWAVAWPLPYDAQRMAIKITLLVSNFHVDDELKMLKTVHLFGLKLIFLHVVPTPIDTMSGVIVEMNWYPFFIITPGVIYQNPIVTFMISKMLWHTSDTISFEYYINRIILIINHLSM